MNLRPDEIARIRAALGREPSTVELHAFDAQWSEHCSYKSSRRFLKRLPVTGERVVVGVGQDAGIVHLGTHEGERYGIVVAHESHNHPSQVVPFEGAATGVGGIVRDVLCMGAEVIGLADALRFGDTSDPASPQSAIAEGAVEGIAAYGNAIGVPNVAGDRYDLPGFDDNCLVNVVAIGVVKESEIIHSRAPRGSAGWDLVLVGKATDPSGFGGASFSSATLDGTGADANTSAVQVPDPFLKNVVMRATYRVFDYLREHRITSGFKDLGAGGIMGCSAELCAAGGYGAIVDLDDVNVAVEGMPPEVIAVGETQERLLWVLPPHATADVLRIYNEEFTLPQIARHARAVVIGCVSDDKRYVLRHGAEIVMDVDIDFLTGTIHDDLPYDARVPSGEAGYVIPSGGEAGLVIPSGAKRSRGTGGSGDGDAYWERYDTSVRGRTVLPRGAAEAGVIAPIPGSRLGVALAVAGDPRIADAYAAGRFAVEEAARKVRSVGATPIALTDCLNFGDPNDPAQLGDLVAAVDGLADAARELGLPFVSGNVSLYNASAGGEAIPPSPIVACIGAIDDIGTLSSPAARRAMSSRAEARSVGKLSSRAEARSAGVEGPPQGSATADPSPFETFAALTPQDDTSARSAALTPQDDTSARSTPLTPQDDRGDAGARGGKRAAVLVFPGTNSEDETLRMLREVGIAAELVHWSRGETLPDYDAYVLPGGFAYEDRIRAGAIPAHDRMMDHVIAGAQAGKLVLGICNGAQILLEAGLVPGTGPVRRPTAAFTRNAQRRFLSRHVRVRLAIDPQRSPFTAHLAPGAVIPAWASHGEGRLAASPEHLREIVEGGHVAFTYEGGAPNGSALDCAALLNRAGNVLAIMPHPERDGWNFNHPADAQGADPLAPSGGSAFFRGMAIALR